MSVIQKFQELPPIETSIINLDWYAMHFNIWQNNYTDDWLGLMLQLLENYSLSQGFTKQVRHGRMSPNCML